MEEEVRSKEMGEAHEAEKKAIRTEIIKLKFELDKVLSLKINL